MSMYFTRKQLLGAISGILFLPFYAALSGCGLETSEVNSEQQSLSEVIAKGEFAIPTER